MYAAEMTKAIPWQSRVIPEPNTGCWLWEGPVNFFGYGLSHHSRVHRLAWEEANGPIPDGLFVLHRCDVPSCCNPDHLFLGTHQDNADDKKRKGRDDCWDARARRTATHCKHGHAFTEANTWLYRGRRHCRTCRVETTREWRAERVP
jgi:hypothetical protein